MKRKFQNKIRLIILLLVSVFMITGCEKIQFGEPYNCRIGVRYWPGDNVSFVIDSIRDYRCPQDMLCFWSGDVDIFLSVSVYLDRVDTLLNLNRKNRIFETDKYTFTVIDVIPWLKSNEKIGRNEYRVRMQVDRKWP